MSVPTQRCVTTEHPTTGSCYWMSFNLKTWPDALESCESEGGTLAAIESQGVADFISARSVTDNTIILYCSYW